MKVWQAQADDIYTAGRRAGVEVNGSQGVSGSPLRKEGRALGFTLKPVGDKWRRRSHTGRRIAAVCWHGHYAFMRELFDLAPDAVLDTKMVRYNGRQDFEENADRTAGRNIGSMMYPMAYAHACDCDRQAQREAYEGGHEIQFATLARSDDTGELVQTNVRMIRQSDIKACPFLILVPTHYREDGSCRCDDAEHRQMMMKEWEYEEEDFKDIPLKTTEAG